MQLITCVVALSLALESWLWVGAQNHPSVWWLPVTTNGTPRSVQASQTQCRAAKTLFDWCTQSLLASFTLRHNDVTMAALGISVVIFALTMLSRVGGSQLLE